MSEIAEALREQSVWCERLGSPFTAQLMERLAADHKGGGPVAALVADWSADPRRDALGLRIAGALHAAVLTGRDEALAAGYPRREEPADMDRVWNAARDFLTRDGEWVRAFLALPPQTNEVGRSGVLAAGFMWLAGIAPQPFRMLELGASAGLNMGWDAFRYAHSAWRRDAGPGPLIPTEIEGEPPRWQEIRAPERLACDRAPVDALSEQGALRLRAYVWPDQFDRLERLEAAIALARNAPWRVEAANATDWLDGVLSGRLIEGTTVIYHSIFLQYPDLAERQAIADAIFAAGAGATKSRQLAWVRFEPEAVLGGPGDSDRMVLNLRVWDGSGSREVELGEADPHGWRLRWFGEAA